MRWLRRLTIKGSYISNGYRRVKCPPEFQYLADGRGYVREHRLVYQMAHPETRLTRDDHIHHGNEQRLDNDIKNLHKTTKPEHARLHNKKDMSGRSCLLCNAVKSSQDWFKHKDGFICRKCYLRKLKKSEE